MRESIKYRTNDGVDGIISKTVRTYLTGAIKTQNGRVDENNLPVEWKQIFNIYFPSPRFAVTSRIESRCVVRPYSYVTVDSYTTVYSIRVTVCVYIYKIRVYASHVRVSL